MTGIAALDAYGVLSEPDTLTIKRLLPGPIERVWAYLTESDLRRKWMAAGEMEMRLGGAFELTWRNDELTRPTGKRPDGFGAEHSMQGRITELDPPFRLGITWGSTGGVSFELEQKGRHVLLTVVHRRVADRAVLLMVSAGWHAHLDILAARIGGTEPGPFWDHWTGLKTEYESRIPA